MVIIGLDFGNYNSFPCFISDLDEKTREGKDVHDLLPGGLNDGIPSVFFYSKKVGILCGEKAVRGRAKPEEFRIRYLKRSIGKPLVLDGTELSYDQAITEVIQHCVRSANEILNNDFRMTTNLISLSYPTTYTFAQKQRLVELAEKATLVDGRHIKVYGTIKEPAAAALDYLAMKSKDKNEKTVLVYDLGGGTFDLALVSAYPEGRKDSDGDVYYYDILDTAGIQNLGGNEFDNVMYSMLLSKFDVPLKNSDKEHLRIEAEERKKDLTSDDFTEAYITYDDEYINASITREEFEKESKSLLMRTIDETVKILRKHSNHKPDVIILTGGASKMPMVQNQLKIALPEFSDKIIFFRPSKAIAYGAARFGVFEKDRSVSVINRVDRDIGVRFFNSREDKKGYLCTYIKAGTIYPCESKYVKSCTLFDPQRYVRFGVYEANKDDPNENEVERDYTEIMEVTLDHGKEVPKGTGSESILIIDKRGLLTIEARIPDEPGKPPVSNSVELKNLS